MIEKINNQEFDQLVVEHQDRIYNLCYRFMGNHHDAGDCAQDTFVRAYKAFDKFRGDAAVSTSAIEMIILTTTKEATSEAEAK